MKTLLNPALRPDDDKDKGSEEDDNE